MLDATDELLGAIELLATEELLGARDEELDVVARLEELAGSDELLARLDELCPPPLPWA